MTCPGPENATSKPRLADSARAAARRGSGREARLDLPLDAVAMGELGQAFVQIDLTLPPHLLDLRCRRIGS